MHPWMLVETTVSPSFNTTTACDTTSLVGERKGVHLYSVMSPGKMIFAVLEQ